MPASVRVEASADERWMSVALDLARRGRPAPNPPVGAVVVRGGLAVGRGWHYRAGGAHAEVVAIAAAGRLARLATLYVTLEPCNHTGRTPPCTEAILKAKCARVVVGCHRAIGVQRRADVVSRGMRLEGRLPLVLGARVPIILTSRADSVRSRLASCAVGVLYAEARRRIAALPAA